MNEPPLIRCTNLTAWVASVIAILAMVLSGWISYNVVAWVAGKVWGLVT